VSDPRSWRARFEQELKLRQPACPECRMRTFHKPECSHSKLTPDQRETARWRRRMIDATIRRICTICHLEILAGEDRATGLPPRHLDCAIELEAHLDEEHRA
jgi:hypothetical protein